MEIISQQSLSYILGALHIDPPGGSQGAFTIALYAPLTKKFRVMYSPQLSSA